MTRDFKIGDVVRIAQLDTEQGFFGPPPTPGDVGVIYSRHDTKSGEFSYSLTMFDGTRSPGGLFARELEHVDET